MAYKTILNYMKKSHNLISAVDEDDLTTTICKGYDFWNRLLSSPCLSDFSLYYLCGVLVPSWWTWILFWEVYRMHGFFVYDVICSVTTFDCSCHNTNGANDELSRSKTIRNDCRAESCNIVGENLSAILGEEIPRECWVVVSNRAW